MTFIEQFFRGQGFVPSPNLDVLSAVKHLVSAGFAIHRLHPKSKAPVGNDWAAKTPLSFEQLRKTFREGENVGVRLGQWSKVGGGFLHAVDMDIRDPKLADQARARLDELFPDWRSFPIVVSGSGGDSRHIYLITDRAFPSKKLAHSVEKIVGKDGKKHWAWEIELFGTGKQVAIPPSIHPDTGLPYRWESTFDFDNLDLGIGPTVTSDRIAALVEADEPSSDLSDDERAQPLGLSDDEIKRILWLIPTETYCDDRDGWLAVGMALHHETGGSTRGFELWCDFASRSDKFDKKDQRRVWRSFKGKARPLRMSTLVSAARTAERDAMIGNLDDEFDDLGPEEGVIESQFDDLLGGTALTLPITKREQKLNTQKVEAELGVVPKKVQRLNRKHAVASINGKTVIITEGNDGSTAYGTPYDLHSWYENDRIDTERSTEPVSKWWMRQKGRRQYVNGIVFAPGEEVEGAYNHWRGFAVEPDPHASCDLFLDHLRIIVCAGDEVAYRWVVRWLAHMIQKPWEKPGTALVLCGKKGTGKDTVGDYVGSLFPRNHVKISNQEHLIGRFNAHQEKALLLQMEEGYWAGNRSAEGPLKSLITNDYVTIEPKGLNAFQVKSVLRLLLTSNEGWVIPATGDERRFCVLNVSDARMQDHGYFKALRHERDNGGRGALLHYLQNVDLTDFDVTNPPTTEGLLEQKIESLHGFKLWWYERLLAGDLLDDVSADLDQGGAAVPDWGEGWIYISREGLREQYITWSRTHARDKAISSAQFGRELNQLCPSMSSKHLRRGEVRIRSYGIPPLSVCREHFETELRQKIDWDE